MKQAIIILTCVLCVITLYFWYAGGAWAYGEMPTKGVLKVVGFSLLGFICLALAARIKSKSD